MVTITYFTHGTTTDNEVGLATGWLPGTLSKRGKQQTLELGKTLANLPFDVLFSSDLRRAIDSAILLFGHDAMILQDKRLREANYGDWNGKPHTFKDTLDEYINTPFPNGESYCDVEDRMRQFCNDLRATYDGKHLAIVSHQAPQLALEVICNSMPWHQAIQQDWRKHAAWQPGWTYYY